MDGSRSFPRREARVRLAHYPPTPAELTYISRSRWNRALRAIVATACVPPAALVAFLIPPHGEPLFLALGLGGYLVYREATTRFVVREFCGSCPRCGSPLTLKRGTRLTSARAVPCYGCHFHPTIEIEPVEGQQAQRPGTAVGEPNQ